MKERQIKILDILFHILFDQIRVFIVVTVRYGTLVPYQVVVPLLFKRKNKYLFLLIRNVNQTYAQYTIHSSTNIIEYVNINLPL